MRIQRTLLALSAVLVAGLFLSACDEAEQGRVLRYEKGTYMGPKDQALSSEQQADLRARSHLQN